jgi:hypothetical protein
MIYPCVYLHCCAYNEELTHWKQERYERRRQEEPSKSRNTKQRGYEEAKFDLEGKMAMPKEEFDKCQKISKEKHC